MRPEIFKLSPVKEVQRSDTEVSNLSFSMLIIARILSLIKVVIEPVWINALTSTLSYLKLLVTKRTVKKFQKHENTF